MALAAIGQRAEAERVLAEVPPDRLAIYPGLGPSAAAEIAAPAGPPEAVDLAFAAADEAWAAGGIITTVAFLADAARLGAAQPATVRLERVGERFNTPITQARALGIRGRATGDGKALLEAAEHHFAVGVVGETKLLADLAVAALGRGSSNARMRAEALARQAGLRLRNDNAVGLAAAPSVRLTKRELEVARLAANGMTDRDIAGVLTVSVRTVESHLAAAYRKLDIRSRQSLPGALRVTA
jgi:DNA-binding CsgD family transcriptional regulator